MELLLFIVGAVIWMVIKSLTQKPPQQPPVRSATPHPHLAKMPERSDLYSPKRELSDRFVLEDESLESIKLEGFDETDAVEHDCTLSEDTLVAGIIMREVLGPPRSKLPHRRASR